MRAPHRNQNHVKKSSVIYADLVRCTQVRSLTTVLFLAAAIGAAWWALAGNRSDPPPIVAARTATAAPTGTPPPLVLAAVATRVLSPRATATAAVAAPPARPAIRPIQHPYPARADQLPVSYAPGVQPNPELERRVAERELALRRDHWGAARLRRGRHHGRPAAGAADQSELTK
jgi:hypothetical protein